VTEFSLCDRIPTGFQISDPFPPRWQFSHTLANKNSNFFHVEMEGVWSEDHNVSDSESMA
jgi:hypothetical protein